MYDKYFTLCFILGEMFGYSKITEVFACFVQTVLFSLQLLIT